jgi:predicted P-loop ATPase
MPFLLRGKNPYTGIQSFDLYARFLYGFDEFAGRTIAKGTPWGTETQTWGGTDDIRAADWLQHHRIYVSKEIAAQAVELIAKERSFHPVRQYFESLKWDGKGRLNSFLIRYFGASSSTYTAAIEYPGRRAVDPLPYPTNNGPHR